METLRILSIPFVLSKHRLISALPQPVLPGLALLRALRLQARALARVRRCHGRRPGNYDGKTAFVLTVCT